MRALLGPLNPSDYSAAAGDLGSLDVRCFDRRGADITFDPARESLEALWSRLPSDFVPDCLIWWSPEYTLVPEGIESCPVPTIAVLGDWNLGVWSTAPLLEAFDWVVTDARGVQIFGPQLEVPVDGWPAFSFDARRHRRVRDVERDIDVLFVGSMNPDVQTDRMPWLGRLARLSDRYRVVLASGVYGDAYPVLLNRARIVWNRSIRGELNMRAYEAPACGATLFMERENLEVRDVFTDGESCVLYGADDLERRLAACLDDRRRCEHIAEAGWRRVQTETYRHHLESLLERARHLRRGPRTFASLPQWRRDLWLGLHALSTGNPDRATAALRHLSRAARHADNPGTVLTALGAVSVSVALEGPAHDRGRAALTASRLYDQALALDPDDVVTHVNAAWLAGAMGKHVEARSSWLAARALLKSDGPLGLDRALAPFGFDRFRVEWERAAIVPDAATRADALRVLLRARVAAALAELELDDEARLAWWNESVVAAAGIDGNLGRRAATLEALGHNAEALTTHLAVLAANPFDASSRLAAARLARPLDADEVLETVLADAARIVAAAPDQASALAGLTTATPFVGSAR